MQKNVRSTIGMLLQPIRQQPASPMYQKHPIAYGIYMKDNTVLSFYHEALGRVSTD